MKIITLLAILVLITVSIIISQTVFAQTPSLKIWTDKPNYSANDTITISGYVDKIKTKFVHDLEFIIYNPQGQIYTQGQIPLDSDGRFNYQTRLVGDLAVSGLYLVRAWWPDESGMDTSISFQAEATPTLSILNLDVRQGSVELSYSGNNITETIEYTVVVNPKSSGQLHVDIFKNDKYLRTDTLTTADVIPLSNGGQYYYYKLTMDGKQDQDVYRVDFNFDGKSVEKIIPIKSSSMGIINNDVNEILPPLQQFRSGIAADHILCKKDLYVILKAENSFPACVSIETGKKLALRGWATTFGTSITTDYWTTCDKPAPKSDSGTAVLYMPTNSIGKICLTYSNYNNEPEPVTPPGISDPNNSYQKPKDITIWTYTPISAISNINGTTVAYFIKTGNQTGFYGLSLPSCEMIPFAVGYNNDSKIVSSDFPFLGVAVSCPPGRLYPNFDGIEGIGAKYIP